MKKFMKIVKIIVICLAIALGVAYAILYIVNPEQAKSILDTIMDYANRPLPIIGVSIGLVGYIALKIFSSTIYGKRNLIAAKAEYKEESSKAKAEYESYKKELEATVSGLKEVIVKICETSPNKKIKSIGSSYAEKCKGVSENGEKE